MWRVHAASAGNVAKFKFRKYSRAEADFTSDCTLDSYELGKQENDWSVHDPRAGGCDSLNLWAQLNVPSMDGLRF
jgi:hypothetical protein